MDCSSTIIGRRRDLGRVVPVFGFSDTTRSQPFPRFALRGTPAEVFIFVRFSMSANSGARRDRVANNLTERLQG